MISAYQLILVASIPLVTKTVAFPFSEGFGLSRSAITTSRSVDRRDSPVKKGYVAFGDSYGAGMGTGTTSTNSCRVGSNNFADLIKKWVNNDSIDYQRKVCSGDTTRGLNRQIDGWENPKNADIATVSIGGNDLGFSNLVWYCVITPNTSKFGSTNRKDCLNAEAKARKLLDDTSSNGLPAKLTAAYKKIRDKSGRNDFHVYVTSYVDFFNTATTDCDKTTFHYVWQRYKPPSDWPANRVVLLTTDLRKELNDLVQRLNKAISNAVEAANHQHGSERVHFVDLQPKWNDQHHWCEKGNFHEPNAGRQDTWFFLSAWNDVPIEGQSSVETIQDVKDLRTIKGGIKLPDAKSCNGNLGTDPDPHDWWMCRAAEAIAQEPDGPIAQSLTSANKQLAAMQPQLNGKDSAANNETLTANANEVKTSILSDPDDIHTNHIGWWLPTRQIKTFHPRSPGMVAYRDAIIAAMNSVQSATPDSTPTTAPPAAADICGDWYKFLYDHFEIYGKNFDPTKFGRDGSGLKHQIKGCGDLTKWHFEPKTNDPHGYQWYASGNLPIGTKGCVGRAVVSAGGGSPDGCTGAG